MAEHIERTYGRFRLIHDGRDVRGFHTLPDALRAEREYRHAFTGSIRVVDSFACPTVDE